jgi:hypothetical protein
MLFSGPKMNRTPPLCPRHPLHSVPCHFCEEENKRMRQELIEWVKSNKEKEDALSAEDVEHLK